MDTVTRYTWKFRFVLLALAVAWSSLERSQSLENKARVERTLTAGHTAPAVRKAAIRHVRNSSPRRARLPHAWPVTTLQQDRGPAR